jgi:hypothetical protein
VEHVIASVINPCFFCPIFLHFDPKLEQKPSQLSLLLDYFFAYSLYASSSFLPLVQHVVCDVASELSPWTKKNSRRKGFELALNHFYFSVAIHLDQLSPSTLSSLKIACPEHTISYHAYRSWGSKKLPSDDTNTPPDALPACGVSARIFPLNASRSASGYEVQVALPSAECVTDFYSKGAQVSVLSALQRVTLP